MKNDDFFSLALEFEDEDKFDNDDDAFDAGLHSAAMMLIDQLRTLNQGMLTDKGVSELLDFIGPFGPGLHCFNAWCYLDTGRLDGDYDNFTAWLRHECRQKMADGKVKAAGQKRDRTKNTKNFAIADLFCDAESQFQLA